MRNKILARAFLVLAVLFAAFPFLYLGYQHVRAQGQNQISTIVGQVYASNYLAPTAGAQMAAVGGVVTNPSSNFIVQVAGGAAFCYGGQQADVPQVQMALLASTTYLVVYNCNNQSVYAKTAVTGPGTLSPNQPGVPATILTATYPIEIPIATVVCNATACGNGGNGSITDARVPGQWAIGTPTGGHLITPGATNDVAFTVTLASNTATKTFTVPYQVAPVVVCTDQTTAQLVKAAPTTTNVVVSDTVGATDVVACVVIANPN